MSLTKPVITKREITIDMKTENGDDITGSFVLSDGMSVFEEWREYHTSVGDIPYEELTVENFINSLVDKNDKTKDGINGVYLKSYRYTDDKGKGSFLYGYPTNYDKIQINIQSSTVIRDDSITVDDVQEAIYENWDDVNQVDIPGRLLDTNYFDLTFEDLTLIEEYKESVIYINNEEVYRGRIADKVTIPFNYILGEEYENKYEIVREVIFDKGVTRTSEKCIHVLESDLKIAHFSNHYELVDEGSSFGVKGTMVLVGKKDKYENLETNSVMMFGFSEINHYSDGLVPRYEIIGINKWEDGVTLASKLGYTLGSDEVVLIVRFNKGSLQSPNRDYVIMENEIDEHLYDDDRDQKENQIKMDFIKKYPTLPSLDLEDDIDRTFILADDDGYLKPVKIKIVKRPSDKKVLYYPALDKSVEQETEDSKPTKLKHSSNFDIYYYNSLTRAKDVSFNLHEWQYGEIFPNMNERYNPDAPLEYYTKKDEEYGGWDYESLVLVERDVIKFIGDEEVGRVFKNYDQTTSYELQRRITKIGQPLIKEMKCGVIMEDGLSVNNEDNTFILSYQQQPIIKSIKKLGDNTYSVSFGNLDFNPDNIFEDINNRKNLYLKDVDIYGNRTNPPLVYLPFPYNGESVTFTAEPESYETLDGKTRERIYLALFSDYNSDSVIDYSILHYSGYIYLDEIEFD